MTTKFTMRNLAGVAIALIATIALHGGWLTAMDRDALAIPAVAARA